MRIGNVTSKFTKLTTTLPDTPGINVGGYEGQEIIQNHQVGFAQILYMSKNVAGKPIDGYTS
jgi:iron complex outermembrane receptor protein